MAFLGDRNDGNHNEHGYPDPTASAVIRKLSSEEYRLHKPLKVIFMSCELAGFELEGRITLVDKRTGNKYD